MGVAEGERHSQGVPNVFLPPNDSTAKADGWQSHGLVPDSIGHGRRPAGQISSYDVCRLRASVTPTPFAPGCISPHVFPPLGAPLDLPLLRVVRAWWTAGGGSQSGNDTAGHGCRQAFEPPRIPPQSRRMYWPLCNVGNSEESTRLHSRCPPLLWDGGQERDLFQAILQAVTGEGVPLMPAWNRVSTHSHGVHRGLRTSAPPLQGRRGGCNAGEELSFGRLQ